MSIRIPTGEKLVTYGGGVNSVALLELLRRLGVVPRAIVMSDPGHEWPETLRYRDAVLRPWLRRIGFPDVVVVSRESEAAYRPRSQHVGTLGDECLSKRMLPSVAYPPHKKCSLKYKRDPQLWWAERQRWVYEEVASGQPIVKCIGFDAGEDHRIKPSFADSAEALLCVPWYPLYEAGLERADCIRLIEQAGLPVPRKSACTFCPNNTFEDWSTLRAEHPRLFAYAIEMSRRAEPHLENPDSVGLMRGCMPAGMRQLHVWAQEDCSDLAGDGEPAVPCECAD